MNDSLPASSGNSSIPGPVSGPISTNKELENVPAGSVEVPMPKEVAHETDALPKEVASAGVSVHPTTIPLPQSVVNMGVKPTGANIPMPTATVSLPISDDQIAEGLGKSIKESIRWLAEWCLKRLKQVHIGLQSVHGRLTRVNTHA